MIDSRWRILAVLVSMVAAGVAIGITVAMVAGAV